MERPTKIQTLILAICPLFALPVWADAETYYQKRKVAYGLGNYDERIKWLRKTAEREQTKARYELA